MLYLLIFYKKNFKKLRVKIERTIFQVLFKVFKTTFFAITRL